MNTQMVLRFSNKLGKINSTNIFPLGKWAHKYSVIIFFLVTWGYLSEQFSHKPRFVCSYWKTHYYLLKADVGIPYLNKSVILDQLLVIQVGPIMGNP